MFVQQSRPLACKDFVNNYTTYPWDQFPLVCRKVKGWWVGKSKRKSSKCNSSAASCGIGTVDGGARGLRTDHAASSRLSRALSRLDLPCLSCLSVPCDSLRFTAVYCVCYSASTHNNKRGKLLSSHFSADIRSHSILQYCRMTS